MQSTQTSGLEFEMLQNFFAQAPVGIAIVKGAEYTFEMVNENYVKLVNKSYNALIGKTLDEAFPELNNEVVKELLNGVMQSGKPFFGNEFPFTMKRFGKEEIAYFNFVYQPLRDDDDAVNGIMVVAYEVTEQVISRKRIEDAEERLRLAVEAGELAIYDYNLVTGKVVSSPRLFEICGFEISSNFNHADFLAMIKPEDLPIRNKAFEKAIKTGLLMYEVRITWSDKSTHWIRVRGKVHYNEKGEAVRVVGTIMDITLQKTAGEELEKKVEERASELKKKNEELQRQKEFAEVILDSSVSAIAVYDKEAKLVSVNKIACELYNVRKDEVLNRKLIDIFPAAKGTQAEHDINKALSGEAVHNKVYYSFLAKRYFENFFIPLKDEHGEVYAILSIGRDITELIEASNKLQQSHDELLNLNQQLEKEIEQRRLAEEQLRIKNQQLIEAQELAKIGSWEWDVGKNKVAWSQGMYRVYEMDTSEELTYEIFLKNVHPDDREFVAEKIKTAFETKKFNEFYHRIITPAGNIKTIHARGDIVLDEAGNITKMIGTGQDVTLEKKIEADLISKSSELEYMNNQLQKFAYIASHDLQEPLRKITTFSEFLRSNEFEETVSKKYLDKINSSARRLSVLIKDVLNYSRLSKADELFAEIDLNEVLIMVKNDYELLINEKNVVIESDDLPVIKGIPTQVAQLFSNLIGNAIKFCDATPVIEIRSNITTGGEIKNFITADSSASFLELIFKDNGIGFEQEYAEQIFDIFQRLNSSHQYSGTGIGLALCKKIVENHKGYIAAESELHKGSTFKVYLPLYE